jgi:predicted PurR-regulated permease PerM
VLSVFADVFALLLWGSFWLIPVISRQTVNLYNKADQYTQTTRNYVKNFAKSVRQRYGVDVLPALSDSSEDEVPTAHSEVPVHQKPQSAGEASTKPVPKTISSLEELLDVNQILRGDWLKTTLMTLANNALHMVRSSVGGFVSVVGFLISLIIIPVYLFYFLIDARNISESWQDYLPLKNSRFKTELVSTLTEINGYVIAFFRGQLLVSVINGISTAVGLMIVGLDFGLLIGLVLCVLGLIPYLGILICWIPAVIIASVQGGVGSFVPEDPVWLFPLVVTGIFVLVQKIDSF